MGTSAVIMGIIGIALLYGGLTCCIGIAWYHSTQGKASTQDNKTEEYGNKKSKR
jgi:hypothetical protein